LIPLQQPSPQEAEVRRDEDGAADGARQAGKNTLARRLMPEFEAAQ
jgi:hypothetical protein